MYLHHHGSQESTDRARNTLFYALWVLYALSATIIIVDMLGLSWPDAAVSLDNHDCLTLFQLVVQKIEIVYRLEIIQATVFALCDFITQFILVRTTGNFYHLLY